MNCFQVAVLKRASGWTENSREGISKGSGTYTVGSVLALPSSHCFHSDADLLLIVKVSHSRIHCLDLCANLDGHLEVTFICVGELAQLMKLFVLGRLKKSKMLLG